MVCIAAEAEVADMEDLEEQVQHMRMKQIMIV